MTGTAGRLNTALWIAPAAAASTASAVAFTPGIGLSLPGDEAFYPQMWQDGDQLAIVWSSGDSPRSIAVAALTLPPAATAAKDQSPVQATKVVSVRNNTRSRSARPPLYPKWLAFSGSQRLETSNPPPIPRTGRQFSVGIWVKVSAASGGSQSLLDSRNGNDGGFLIGLHSSTIPFVFLGPRASLGPTTNIEPPTNSSIGRLAFEAAYSGSWVYFGFTVDLTAGSVQFIVGDGLTGRSKEGTLPIENLLEDNGGLRRPPEGGRNPSVTSRCGSLRPFIYADVRYIDDVIAIEGKIENASLNFRSPPSSWGISSYPFNATIGFKNLPSQSRSGVVGLNGLLRTVAVFQGTWTVGQHVQFANREGRAVDAVAFPTSVRAQDAKYGGGGSGGGGSGSGNDGNCVRDDAALWLDATDPASVAANFPSPRLCPEVPAPSLAPPTATTTANALQLCNTYSASIELPPVTCATTRNRSSSDNNGDGVASSGSAEQEAMGVGITMRSRLMQPQIVPEGCSDGTNAHQWTVFTVGDGNAHIRLIATVANSGASSSATKSTATISSTSTSTGTSTSASTDADSTRLSFHLYCSATKASLALLHLDPVHSEDWMTVDSKYSSAGLAVNGSAPFHCGCSMGGVWAFLGEGYLYRNYSYSAGCVQHDIDALLTYSVLSQ